MSASIIFFICSFMGRLTHVQTSHAETSFDAKVRLERMLLKDYNKEARPVLEYNDNVTITVGISLYLIKNMDDKDQILTTSLWIRQKWNDPRLAWKPEDFSSVDNIRISNGNVWLPDLKVYNEIEQRMDSGLDQSLTRVIIQHTGEVLWMSPTVLRSSCQVDIGLFPYDTQTCYLKIGSWTYDGFAVDVKPESLSMDVSKSPSNPAWELVSTNVKRNSNVYPCCTEPYPDITYTITIKRRVQGYWVNFIFPGFFLTMMTIVAFISPGSDIGERVSLVFTTLVSMFFFLKMVAERTPTSDTVPLLSIYFVMLSCEISLIFFSICISVNIYHRNSAYATDTSGRVGTYILESLGRLWGLTKDSQDITTKLDALKDPSSMRDIVIMKLEKMLEISSSTSSPSRTSSNDGLHAENSTGNQTIPTQFTPSADKCRIPEHDMLSSTPSVGNSTANRGKDLVSGTSTCSKTSQLRHLYLSTQNYPTNAAAVDGNLGNLCSCTSLLGEMATNNERLLSSVREISNVARRFDKTSSEKERWLIAASILDRTFLFLFVLAFIVMTLANLLN